jgi:two-component system, LytTR family, sensor kinase
MSLRRSAIIAAWLIIPVIVFATQVHVAYRMRGVPSRFPGWLSIQLIHWEIWAIAGPFVWQLGRRWPLSAARRRASVIRHALAAPAVATAVLAAYIALYHALIRVPALASWFVGLDRSLTSTITFFFLTDFHIQLLIYASVVAVADAVHTTEMLRAQERESLRLSAELTGARLTALRMQLQPHFLFNTLHTIGSLVLQRENERALGILAELGELLRSALAHRDIDLTPLRDEITYLRRYLKIEEARFGDRLRVEWNVDDGAEDALIPPFILQPFVENAFRHGISHRTEESLLRIAAARDDGCVRITVFNEGPPLPDDFDAGAGRGYGLKNAIERLRGRTPAGDVEIVNAPGGVRATLRVPAWAAIDARMHG